MPGECTDCHCTHVGADGHPTGYCDRHRGQVAQNHGCHECAGRDLAALRAQLADRDKRLAEVKGERDDLRKQVDAMNARARDVLGTKAVKRILSGATAPGRSDDG